MVEWATIVLFAFALSMDGFGVGVAYGLRKIKIPIGSLFVISLTSAGAITLSMLGGHVLSRVVSVEVAELIGAVILILVGSWIIFQTWSEAKRKSSNSQEQKAQTTVNEAGNTTSHTTSGEQSNCELMKIRLKPLGLVIQIIREPAAADIDRSGVISGKEAFLLGLALAMDALGAGFGAAMAGFKPLITPLVVGIMKFILVGLGDLVGRRYAANWIGDKAATIPGWVLVVLGIVRVLRL